MTVIQDHDYYLQLALQQAQSRRGFCAPNPAVGAVVVRDGHVISSGRHFAAGHPHAEVDALSNIEHAEGATLYVTLEPCCHHGKTPPCTDLIIQRGVTRVVYSEHDVNPEVAGKGAQQLRDAGIDCQQIKSEAISEFYNSYRYWWQHKKPFVTAKIAISFDGKIAGKGGARVAITGEQCQQLTHQYRLSSDAILTTVRTVIHDDPQLNVRIGADTAVKPIYVIDRNLQFSLSAKICKTSQSITLLCSNDVNVQRKKELQTAGVRCITIASDNNRLNLSEVIKFIGREGVHDLWVEAGGRLFENLYCQNLIQHAIVYRSSRVLGVHAYRGFTDSFYKQLLSRLMNAKTYGDDQVFDLALF